MATVPGALIWEIVKKNNSFLVKEFGNGTQSVQFNKEPNNLCNRNSCKYSGLANKKTITIQPAGKDQTVLLATTNTEKLGQASTLLNKSVMKKKFSSMAKEVSNQLANNFYRPDLEQVALARLRAMKRSFRAAKSAAKLVAKSVAKKRKNDQRKAYAKIEKQMLAQLKAGRWKGSQDDRWCQMSEASWREKKRIYEIMVWNCPDDKAEAMEFFIDIMKDVMGSRKAARAVIVKNRWEGSFFNVRLKRDDLEKLVLLEHPEVGPIYNVADPRNLSIHKGSLKMTSGI